MFFDALSDVGFLMLVVAETGASAGQSFRADYRKPAENVFDGVGQMTEYSIRYQIADVVLRRDDEVTVDGKRFRVSTPRPSGDGTTYCTAALEAIRP